ncbi:MAG: flagellar hook protein FlgE [bacterium]|nr:flagellar hook protein FlgE [bacterium]
MSLTNALFSSVSGLETASTQISVIGDNIANASTPGFKEKRAEFSAVLGQSITAGSGFAQIGAGVLTNDIGTIFTQGVFETTQRPTDLGISGRGFFVLEGSFGRSYTRSGIFGFDREGFLVDPLDNRLQGYGIDPATGQSNGVLGDIQVNLPLSPPQQTSEIALGMNLDASEPLIPGGFDPTDAQGTSSAREVVTVYDSLGTARQATIFFTKTSATDWEYNVTLADADANPATRTGNDYVVQATGTLTFDSSGTLTAASTTNFDFDFETTNGNAQTQNVDFSMGPVGAAGTGAPTTQYDENTVTNFVSQDGFAPGTLSALEFDENGRLNGVFTNGVTQTLAQIALANFGNVEGLTEIGRSQVIESVDSGPAVLAPANSGNLGSIRNSSLEKSNVDLAQQFVNLIVSQRAFQANTRTVSVANELLANLVSLGQ